MAVAVLCAILLFLIQYSRVAVIKRANVRRANRFRLSAQRARLAHLEGAILLYRVEGVLFFATSRQLVSVVAGDLEGGGGGGEEGRGGEEGGGGEGLRRRRRGRPTVAPAAAAAVVPSVRFVILDCSLLQGMDSSATQTFMRLRWLLNERGATLVLCSLPLHVKRTLAREGVLGT